MYFVTVSSQVQTNFCLLTLVLQIFPVKVEGWKYFTCQRSSKKHLDWPNPPILLSEVSLGVGVAGEVDGREGDVPQETGLGTLEKVRQKEKEIFIKVVKLC